MATMMLMSQRGKPWFPVPGAGQRGQAGRTGLPSGPQVSWMPSLSLGGDTGLQGAWELPLADTKPGQAPAH